MARRRRSAYSHVRNSQVRRDALDIASDPLHDLVWAPPAARYLEPPLSLWEDRRLFSPYTPWNAPGPRRIDSFGPARPLVVPDPQSRSRPVSRPSKAYRVIPYVSRTVAFEKPQGVVLCRRRQIRREVLHATGGTSGRVRKPRFSEWSQVSCRRR